MSDVLWVEKLPGAEDIQAPKYQTARAVGMDLYAAQPVTLFAHQRKIVPTGIKIALPDGCEGQIRPRSGLAINNGVTVLNAPGTIDSDYRGEVGVILYNAGDKVFHVKRGMRIAQLVVSPVVRPVVVVVDQLDETERGAGGFGSTGVTDEN